MKEWLDGSTRLLPLSYDKSESDIPVQETVKVLCFKLHQFKIQGFNSLSEPAVLEPYLPEEWHGAPSK